ncbi:hypothetical protein ACLOJK_005900 [Asimina triloba]
MAILYALVARGTVVLAEFSAVSGNTGAVARRILEKLPYEVDSRVCFSQDRYIFHILRSDGLTFLCMTNDTFGRRVPFSYLEDIHMRFMKNYGRVAHSALAYAMNDEFSRVLHQQMEFFSSNPNADTLSRIRGEMRTIMVDNIEKILERGDRIELLVDKTSTMQDGAFHFKKQSRRLRQALWMKNFKLLAFEYSLVTGFIVVSFQGFIDSCASCVVVHNHCRCLWWHHSSFLPILILALGDCFRDDQYTDFPTGCRWESICGPDSSRWQGSRTAFYPFMSAISMKPAKSTFAAPQLMASNLIPFRALSGQISLTAYHDSTTKACHVLSNFPYHGHGHQTNTPNNWDWILIIF